MPFEKLVEELSPQRSLEHTPLFQVLFVLHNAPAKTPELAGLTAASVEIDSPEVQFDWTLTLIEDRGEIRGSFGYRSALWDEVTMVRATAHFSHLLAGLAAAPDSPLSELPLLAAGERQQLLEWNATETRYASEATLHGQIWAQAERTPDAVAVTFESSSLTYRELARRAHNLSVLLRRSGVGPDVAVGICAERSLELVVGLLGILSAGGAYVPIDPAYPQARLKHMLEDSRTPVLLTQEKLLDRLPAVSGQVLCLDTLNLASGGPQAESRSIEPAPENLAYVIYTSGSTGLPKGAMNTHRAILNRLLWGQERFELRADDIVIQKTPASFDVSVWEFFLPLLAGARLALARPGGHQDPLYLARFLEQERVTTAHFVPSMLQVFLESGEASGLGLRRVLCSGEALPQELVNRYLEQIGLPIGAPIYNLYGPTEAAVEVTWWPGEAAGDRPGVPIGRPIANLSIHLLSRSGQPVPIGVAGELLIGGAGLARGYWRRPELTAERFVPEPGTEVPGSRLYRTGDLARYRGDGAIEFLGRLDHQVKIRGLRIELEEIEGALARHPAVGQAVVVVHRVVAGDSRLVAYIVPAPTTAPTNEELWALLKDRLPEYMLPSTFVFLPVMPLTPSGKVDRRSLPAPEWGGETSVEPPKTPLEELVAQVWSEILGIEQVGAGQNFFALGGHSLLATRVVSRLREFLGVELPVRSLFEAPTVRELSHWVEQERHQGGALSAGPIPALPRDFDPPLSFAQERLWFLDQLQPGDSSYNMPMTLALNGSVAVPALAAALNAVVLRHEALRTTFRMSGRAPVQVIARGFTLALPQIDLTGLSGAARRGELQRIAAAEAREPFDLAAGPLVRARLVRLAGAEQVLLLTFHHIVTDGWSNGILAREVAALYQARLAGLPSPLPALPVQYADFAVWQREWLSGAVLAEQLAYWQERLAGAPALLELPTDWPRPLVQRRRGGKLAFSLTEELTRGLVALSRRSGATLFMSLLAAFAALLERYSRQADLVVGSPIAGRTRTEIEGLIGLFLNTLALRVDLSGAPSFNGLLRQAREVTLEAYAHQDLPFEKLVAELAPERNLAHSPIFQVVLVLQNAPMPTLEQPGLAVSPLEIEIETSKFDLTLNLTETPSGLTGWWLFDSDLFDLTTLERLLGH
ncbi:MAG TPA: amino acid adenylation domain-containing protein, partial [Thermoanaerobaculia bacterium]|nr:amino acid adenylation domain-containing protein [Thermoanaerobaculia bacterium]